MYTGDQIAVNGKIFPFKTVSRSLYSFRIVNIGPDEVFLLSFGSGLNMTLSSGVSVNSCISFACGLIVFALR
jgi:FtsP/CotA-like multicopper oxidase with cupredoxin domain